MNDRFKFRVWDKSAEQYVPRSQFILLSDGTLIQEIGGEEVIWESTQPEFCTGLKDKNGKLIYEGDILKAVVYDKNNYCKKETNWSVEYKIYGNCGGFLVYGIDRRWHQLLTFNMIFNCEAVIVGNIHENADLLKGEK